MSKIVEYNFKEFKPVLAVSRTSLRKGQASLYDLLAAKLKSGEAVTIKEARGIWLTKVCRKMYGGVPHRTDYYAEKILNERGDIVGWHAKDVPMTDEEVMFTVMNWLTKNIGILVIRGYLKAIPMVRLV